MTDKRSAADILRQQEATLEAVNPRLAAKCEECGAGMTYVDISDDAVRGWFDHTPDCFPRRHRWCVHPRRGIGTQSGRYPRRRTRGNSRGG